METTDRDMMHPREIVRRLHADGIGGLTEYTLYRLLKTGAIPARKPGRCYIVSYNNVLINTCEGSLEDAKKLADDCAGYTQCNIDIYNDAGQKVAGRSWWGVPYDPNETEDEEDEVIQFGNFGYYGAWYDGCNPLLYTSWRMI